MEAAAQVLNELECVRGLLLVANRPSMLECEARLSNLAGQTERLGLCRGSSEIRASLGNIRFLLNRARDFWSSRGPAPRNQIQYMQGGMIVGPIEKFTFLLEI